LLNLLYTVHDAKQSLTKFFNLYNEKWPHGSLKNMSPNQKLKAFTISQ
jgi:transposase InsO family protein